MREAFDIMGSHPLLTLFLGVVLMVCVENFVSIFQNRK